MQIGNFKFDVTNPFKSTNAAPPPPPASTASAPGDQVSLSGTSQAPPAAAPLSTGEKVAVYGTALAFGAVGAQVGGQVAAAFSPLLGPVVGLGVGALVFQGTHVKVNDRDLKDLLSPFKADKADAPSTATLKKVGNLAIRTGVAVGAGMAAGALVPLAGLMAGGIGAYKLAKGLAGDLFHHKSPPPAPAPQSYVPDFAPNASPDTGYKVSVDGRTGYLGGTGAAAPLAAAIEARLRNAPPPPPSS